MNTTTETAKPPLDLLAILDEGELVFAQTVRSPEERLQVLEKLRSNLNEGFSLEPIDPTQRKDGAMLYAFNVVAP